MADYFCEEQAVPADGSAHYYTLDAAEHVFSCAGLFVDLDVGTGVESVAITVQASDDNTSWYTMYVLDYGGSVAAPCYAPSITLSADAQAVIARIESYAPHLRLQVTNSGANAAELTAFIITH